MSASCGRCGHTWTALTACHCSGCCQPGHGELSTFSGINLFDRHRSAVGERGMCLNPASIRSKDGQPVMWFRNGMWRGEERDPETLPGRGAA